MALDAAPTPTFYRRSLPASHVAFASVEGRALFRAALDEGSLEGYFAIAEQFHTQAEPAFCGLGSLVVALNALAIDPGRSWKGPWRWFGEEMLDCCIPLDEVRRRGLTLDEIACLARCNGARVDVHRADATDAGAFRDAVASSGAEPDRSIVIASYSRAALGQTGEGHFSPVAGLHRERDLALLMDVARFKYPPHWVPVRELWQAMHPVDPETGRARGFLVLRRSEQGRPLTFRLRPSRPWPDIFQALEAHLAATAPSWERAGLVPRLVRAIAGLEDALEVSDVGATDADHKREADALVAALRALPFFQQVATVDALAGASGPGPRAHERAALLVVVLAASHPLASLPAEVRAEAASLVATARLAAPLAAELDALGSQLTLLQATVAAMGCGVRRGSDCSAGGS